jgi:hypothetical protein
MCNESYNFEELFKQAMRDVTITDKRLSDCLEALTTIYNSEVLRGMDDNKIMLRELVKTTIEGATDD